MSKWESSVSVLRQSEWPEKAGASADEAMPKPEDHYSWLREIIAKWRKGDAGVYDVLFEIEDRMPPPTGHRRK